MAAPTTDNGTSVTAPEPAEVDSEAASEALDGEAEVVAPEEASEVARDATIQTPEERLARAETPLNHGSAEADLDVAAPGQARPPRRPSSRAADTPGGARPEPETPADTSDDDASSTQER
jgi:hypothetical protein